MAVILKKFRDRLYSNRIVNFLTAINHTNTFRQKQFGLFQFRPRLALLRPFYDPFLKDLSTSVKTRNCALMRNNTLFAYAIIGYHSRFIVSTMVFNVSIQNRNDMMSPCGVTNPFLMEPAYSIVINLFDSNSFSLFVRIGSRSYLDRAA